MKVTVSVRLEGFVERQRAMLNVDRNQMKMIPIMCRCARSNLIVSLIQSRGPSDVGGWRNEANGRVRERKGSIKQNLILLKFASAITKLNSIPRKTLLKQNHLLSNRFVVTEAGNMLLGCEAVRFSGCARRIKHGDCFCRDFINNSISILNYCRNYLCFSVWKKLFDNDDDKAVAVSTKRTRHWWFSIKF